MSSIIQWSATTSKFISQPQLQAYTQAPRQTALTSDPILGVILELMEQMMRMNSHMEKIQEFVKTNVQPTTYIRRVSFSDQLPSQATTNLRNQGASSNQMHNINYVHVDEEAVETALAISSLRSGKDLPNPYKDHPINQVSINEDIPNMVEHDINSEDEEELAKAEPNPDACKLQVPYPQALNRQKANTTESNDHLLEAFKKVTITIPLIFAIKCIPSYAKFLIGICTPHRNPKRTQLSETVS